MKYIRWLHSKLPFTESNICIRLMIMEGDLKYHWLLPQPCLKTFGVNFIECLYLLVLRHRAELDCRDVVISLLSISLRYSNLCMMWV